MNKILEGIRRFMAGRYGIDLLNKVMMITAFAAVIAANLTQAGVVSIISLFLMISAIFRTYSRNVHKRAEENRKFIRTIKLIRNFFLLQMLKIREIRKHRFRKCPDCRVVIRTSTKRGERELKCPKCGRVFRTRILV